MKKNFFLKTMYVVMISRIYQRKSKHTVSSTAEIFKANKYKVILKTFEEVVLSKGQEISSSLYLTKKFFCV